MGIYELKSELQALLIEEGYKFSIYNFLQQPYEILIHEYNKRT